MSADYLLEEEGKVQLPENTINSSVMSLSRVSANSRVLFLARAIKISYFELHFSFMLKKLRFKLTLFVLYMSNVLAKEYEHVLLLYLKSNLLF